MHQYEYITVDDELSSHFVLEYIMRRFPAYRRKAYFTEPESALYYLSHYSVDLMFLDVEMPEIDGFSMIEKLENPPLTIMVTGYPAEYSEKAHNYYDNGIIDFISKSMEPSRLRKSLDRFEKLSRSIQIESRRIGMHPVFHLENILIQQADNKESVHLNDILYVTVVKNYVFLHTLDGKSHKIRSTLQSFIDSYLPEDYFLKVNRDTVIAMHHVFSFNSYSVNMGKDANGEELLIPIASVRRREVERQLYAYLGKQNRDKLLRIAHNQARTFNPKK